MAEIQFPITVNAIEFDEHTRDAHHPKLLFGGQCGDFVAVRPCGDRYAGKTFLGVLIGETALSLGVRWKEERNALVVARSMYNPMIYVPDLREVVWGCGSWWGKIRDKDHLRSITDEDINNVWYVQALKALDTMRNPDAPSAPPSGEQQETP